MNGEMMKRAFIPANEFILPLSIAFYGAEHAEGKIAVFEVGSEPGFGAIGDAFVFGGRFDHSECRNPGGELLVRPSLFALDLSRIRHVFVMAGAAGGIAARITNQG